MRLTYLLAALLTALCFVSFGASAQDEPAPDAPEEVVELATIDVPVKAQTSSGDKTQLLLFFTFVLAIFLGFELISKVPSQLHTPLMSGANAISGITVVGAILAAGNTSSPRLATFFGFFAVLCATINVIGGYLVTDRMLGMFKSKAGKK